MADVSHREPPPDPADLRGQLMQAYLAGDGGAVERIMALITAVEPESLVRKRSASREAA